MKKKKVRTRRVLLVFSDTWRDARDYHDKLPLQDQLTACRLEDIALAKTGIFINEPWSETNYPRPTLLAQLLKD